MGLVRGLWNRRVCEKKIESLSEKKERIRVEGFVLGCDSGAVFAAGADTPVLRCRVPSQAAETGDEHEILSKLRVCCLRPGGVHTIDAVRVLQVGPEASADEK